MPLDVTGVVQNAEYLNYVCGAAVDQDMPRLMHHAERRPSALPAEGDCINGHARPQLRMSPRARSLGVLPDVVKRLGQQVTVALGGVFTKLAAAPNDRFGQVALCRPCDENREGWSLTHAHA